MRYNQYLYRLPVQAVLITDIVKNSILSADIVTDAIIGTSLTHIQELFTRDHVRNHEDHVIHSDRQLGHTLPNINLNLCLIT